MNEVHETETLSTATDHHRSIDRMACSLRSGRSLGLLQFSTIRYLEPSVSASLKTGGKLKYSKLYDAAEKSEQVWIEKIKDQLEQNLRTGQPLRFDWFREKKLGDKRLFYSERTKFPN